MRVAFGRVKTATNAGEYSANYTNLRGIMLVISEAEDADIPIQSSFHSEDTQSVCRILLLIYHQSNLPI